MEKLLVSCEDRDTRQKQMELAAPTRLASSRHATPTFVEVHWYSELLPDILNGP